LNPYHYVLGFGHQQNEKKHLLRTATVVWELWPSSKLLLDSPPWTLNQIVQAVATRMLLSRLKATGDLVDLLYRDPVTGKQKPGVVDPRTVRSGDLRHRLPARIRQLEVTHDLTDLTAEQLLNLLGDEFRQWAVVRGRPPAAAPRPAQQAAPLAPSTRR
jgi:hypothetical protein